MSKESLSSFFFIEHQVTLAHLDSPLSCGVVRTIFLSKIILNRKGVDIDVGAHTCNPIILALRITLG